MKKMTNRSWIIENIYTWNHNNWDLKWMKRGVAEVARLLRGQPHLILWQTEVQYLIIISQSIQIAINQQKMYSRLTSNLYFVHLIENKRRNWREINMWWLQLYSYILFYMDILRYRSLWTILEICFFIIVTKIFSNLILILVGTD